jgi:hypothetical protein
MRDSCSRREFWGKPRARENSLSQSAAHAPAAAGALTGWCRKKSFPVTHFILSHQPPPFPPTSAQRKPLSGPMCLERWRLFFCRLSPFPFALCTRWEFAREISIHPSNQNNLMPPCSARIILASGDILEAILSIIEKRHIFAFNLYFFYTQAMN